MKLNKDKLLYLSAAVFFISLSLAFFVFNGTFLLIPLLIVATVAIGAMTWSSTSIMVKPLEDLEKSEDWKKLSKKEQWVIIGLVLSAMGIMVYLNVKFYVGGPLTIALAIALIKGYSRIKNK